MSTLFKRSNGIISFVGHRHWTCWGIRDYLVTETRFRPRGEASLPGKRGGD